eukprot:TRINITY_DN1711_c0_g1_i1.p2 TRINITY_DN1711_c0_g1~~TRINITY_DN1711_c0_g1_i1.p2  ORF type:complete len:124 (+),score=18.41 TRINITY_DN1711_c0_g1_i1:493-864(+)
METKKHHPQSAIDRFQAEKIGKDPRNQSEQDDVPEAPRLAIDELQLKQREIKALTDLIRAEQKKIRICHYCKRKFVSLEQLRYHEEYSELHKKVMESHKQGVSGSILVYPHVLCVDTLSLIHI